MKIVVKFGGSSLASAEQFKKVADIIIPEGGFNSVALEMLLERIRTFINR